MESPVKMYNEPMAVSQSPKHDVDAVEARLIECIRTVIAAGIPEGEKELQLAMQADLGDGTLDELRAEFDDPAYAPPHPVGEDTATLKKKGKHFRDVCAGDDRSVDLLWEETIPIELKFTTAEKRRKGSDVVGYGVLLDIHRMERLVRLSKSGQVYSPGMHRLAVLVTNHEGYWKEPWTINRGEGPREPKQFSLAEGRTLSAPYWACFHQPSAIIRWIDNAPFFLANRYESLRWFDVGNGFRALIVRVEPQPQRSST